MLWKKWTTQWPVQACCWSHVSRAWHTLGPGYMHRYGAEVSHTSVYSPASSQPTAGVTEPWDAADRHYAGVPLHNIGRIGPLPSAPPHVHTVFISGIAEQRFSTEDSSTWVCMASTDVMGFGNAWCTIWQRPFSLGMSWATGTFMMCVGALTCPLGLTSSHCGICMPLMPGNCMTWPHCFMQTHIVTPIKLKVLVMCLDWPTAEQLMWDEVRFFQGKNWL